MRKRERESKRLAVNLNGMRGMCIGTSINSCHRIQTSGERWTTAKVRVEDWLQNAINSNQLSLFFEKMQNQNVSRFLFRMKKLRNDVNYLGAIDCERRQKEKRRWAEEEGGKRLVTSKKTNETNLFSEFWESRKTEKLCQNLMSSKTNPSSLTLPWCTCVFVNAKQ